MEQAQRIGGLFLGGLGLCCFCVPSADAARALVVHRISGCDYFMVQSGRLYDLLEWYGGHDPDKDDVIVGKFETYGMADIYDETADEELRVWVEEYSLAKEDALEKLADKCE
jgi:hypothetical protein